MLSFSNHIFHMYRVETKNVEEIQDEIGHLQTAKLKGAKLQVSSLTGGSSRGGGV